MILLPETVALETLRQSIEAALQESGNLADYLDRGRPDAAQRRKAQQQMNELTSRAAAWRQDLARMVAAARAEHLPAFEQWIALHQDALRRIVLAEPAGDPTTKTRRMLAAGAVHEWECVRQGSQSYVGINWYFLADHQAAMRRLVTTLGFGVLPF